MRGEVTADSITVGLILRDRNVEAASCFDQVLYSLLADKGSH